MNLTASFTAPPEFTVLSGRTEIGRTDPDLLTEETDGPRKLLLAGRSWLVTYIDRRRRRCFVEPVDEGGRAKWSGFRVHRVRSFTLARAVRDVLIGGEPPVTLTRRAEAKLAATRETYLDVVHPAGTVITRRGDSDVRWWTWAGTGRTPPWPRRFPPWSFGTGPSTTASSGCATTSPRSRGGRL
ncbi:hypothetical protein [Streptomyces sp. NPDC058698]|uniref:hypothetical protein n=1 Tax=Streptomyces sp. NPDC058698 TaxID=3346606 RepID=UPI003663E4BC